jgi:glycosyltransferase involved in cell wall biosynthesis
MKIDSLNTFEVFHVNDMKVSVCVMTYNQKDFIHECLQSILDQKVNFKFEVIVADDSSSDGTQEIIKNFAEKYPELIIPILHKKNIGVSLNYRSAHDRARGEYVAHCDGDDMWLPGKLMYQVSLLDQNPDASQCWGCAYLIDDKSKRIGIFPSRIARLFNPTLITAKDIALSYALVGQHSTQMYRRSFKFNFDATKPVLDFWIAYNMALNGPAIYSKEFLGGYRMTSMPSMTRSVSNKRATVDFLAVHLTDIINMNPELAVAAKANMLARKVLSKIRGHDVTIISREIERCKRVRFSFWQFTKSILFFSMQKFQ